ncbi:MAG: hypothetical protein NZ699_14265 [Roseiflexus sp.]|nr:hypothetical protein [Roseiflexus sp.]MCS7290291.1 hypothetical protein [Roseiflexus sp.]MDW8146045.1 hypothetical protein [Roseiflexaceae bacterium]MDW8231293.1 hypothetical protein [Roseiflexaceae bacterium]
MTIETVPRYRFTVEASAHLREVGLLHEDDRDAGRPVIEQYTMPVANEYTLLHEILPGGRITAVLLPQVSFTTDALCSS